MRKRPSLALLALVVVLATGLVAACSSGSSKLSSKEQQYADSFAKHLSDKTQSFGVTTAQGHCIGDAIMHVLGTKPFDKAKVTPDQVNGGKSPGELLGTGAVTQNQAAAIAKKWEGCVDLPKVLAAQLTPQFKLTDTSKACFQTALSKNGVSDRYLEVSFTGSGVKDSAGVLSEIFGLVQTCTADASHQGGYFVDSMSSSLGADGKLTPTQARCVAQHVVDAIGIAKLAEVSVGGLRLGDQAPGRRVQQGRARRRHHLRRGAEPPPGLIRPRWLLRPRRTRRARPGGPLRTR